MPRYRPVDTDQSFPALEEEVLARWREHDVFHETLRRREGAPLYVFYEGPPTANGAPGAHHVLSRVVEEIAVVQPRIVVVMGERALATLNDLQLPLSRRLEARLGEIQRLTPSIDALYVPDIDGALDEQRAKQDFWTAFRPLGDWYEQQPPY